MTKKSGEKDKVVYKTLNAAVKNIVNDSLDSI